MSRFLLRCLRPTQETAVRYVHSVTAHTACIWLDEASYFAEIDRRTKALPANPRRSPPPPHPNATCLHLEVTSTRLKRLPPHAGLVPLWMVCPGSAGIRQRFFVLARTGHIHECRKLKRFRIQMTAPGSGSCHDCSAGATAWTTFLAAKPI